MSAKLASVNWSEISVSAAKAKLSVFSRITKAYTSGKYRTIPWKAIVTILGAIIYFLNPVDLIPDFIPGLGLTDDFGVLVWVYGSLSVEIDKFLGWESEISIL